MNFDPRKLVPPRRGQPLNDTGGTKAVSNSPLVNYGYKYKFIKSLRFLGVTQKLNNQYLTHVQHMIPNKVKSKKNYDPVQTE